ncbi:MAG: RNA-guided endonuclease TnpB family protein [Promethearchaeota archaeon]
MELLYDKKVPFLPVTAPTKLVGTDIGLNNLITNVNNIGERPIIVKGGIVKSINQYYNKERTHLQSMYDKQGIPTGQALKKITDHRDKKLHDFFHKVSRMYIDWYVAHKIDTIIIGWNKGWKQQIKVGKKTNQNFVSIPFSKFLHMLTYKAEDVGIRVIFTREDYTSKCSFLDKEPIHKHKKYIGNRIHRGLFKTATGILINSDVNGGYNIIVHVIPNAFSHRETADGIAGVWLHPVRWRLVGQPATRMTPDEKEDSRKKTGQFI